MTINDVAHRAKVHALTVSPVLNVKTRDMASKEVADRVIETAQKLG